MYDYIQMYNTKENIEEIINEWRTDLYVELQNQGIDVTQILKLEVHLSLNKEKFKTNEKENENS